MLCLIDKALKSLKSRKALTKAHGSENRWTLTITTYYLSSSELGIIVLKAVYIGQSVLTATMLRHFFPLLS